MGADKRGKVDLPGGPASLLCSSSVWCGGKWVTGTGVVPAARVDKADANGANDWFGHEGARGGGGRL